MTLRELLADAACQLDGVATDLEPDGTVTWSRAGRLFSSVDPGGAVAEFALDPAVAAAAAADATLGEQCGVLREVPPGTGYCPDHSTGVNCSTGLGVEKTAPDLSVGPALASEWLGHASFGRPAPARASVLRSADELPVPAGGWIR